MLDRLNSPLADPSSAAVRLWQPFRHLLLGPPPAPGPDGLPDANAERLRQLNQMKRLALVLLGGMAAIFLLTKGYEGDLPWLAYPRSFAEAAMVGAMADWFAVTALFRHPVGLPIPHTAIIPRNKDRIGVALGRFIENNFLKPEEVAGKLQTVDIARRIGDWLVVPANAEQLSGRLAAGFPRILDSLDDEQIRGHIEHAITARIRKLEVGPLLGDILQSVTGTTHQSRLLEAAIDIISKLIEENKGSIRERIADKSNWWVPSFVDQRIFDSIVNSIQELSRDFKDPNLELRGRIDKSIESLIKELKENPEYTEKIDAFLDALASNQAIRRYIGNIWDEVKANIHRDIEREDSEIRAQLAKFFEALGRAFIDEPAINTKVNAFVQGAVLTVIVPYRHEIGDFIASVVQKWDTALVTEKIELAVGRDLQFIRINGTIVGGCVGLGIHIAWQIIGG